MNDQRKVIFEQRLELMDDDNVSETITEMRHDVVEDIIQRFVPERAYPEQWNTEGLNEAAKTYLNVNVQTDKWAEEEGIDVTEVTERLTKAADETAAAKAAQYTPNIMRQIEKQVLLQSLDGLWREHLVTLDHLSKVVGWRAIAQRDPLNEYKQEAYELFQGLLDRLRELVITQISHVQIQTPQEPEMPKMQESHINPQTGKNEVGEDSDLNMDNWGKVRRNDPCPCGSGKKIQTLSRRLLVATKAK